MKLYIVYRTDAWLSYASRDVCGIFGSKANAIKEIMRNAKPESKDAKFMLAEFGQTQGLDVNYQIEEINLNEWID